MEEVDGKINSWVRNHLIPRLAKNEPNVEFTIARPTGNYFLSDPFFMTLRSPKSGEKKMLVKLPSQDPVVLEIIDYDPLFENEIAFYNELAGGDSDYPECYFAGKDPVFRNTIVLEDLRPRGFVDSPDKIDVHLDYIVAGLRALARFHAKMYAVKEKEPEKFRKFVGSLHESRFPENPLNEKFRDVINTRMKGVIQAIRARNDNSKLTKKLCDVFDDVFVNVMIKCAKPAEPLSTVAHGDCTINNLLYRWEKTDGEKPNLKAMLIDFGLLMYSSPIVDISTLLYMTCTREDIRDRAKDLLEAYHSSLKESMQERGIWNASKYSLENFQREYRSRAVFGFIIAAFFRGMMSVFDRQRNDLEVTKMSDWWQHRDESAEATSLLVDMLDDLRNAGMLDDYVGE